MPHRKKIEEMRAKRANSIEKRVFGMEIRAVEADGDAPPMLIGYPAKFNSWSVDLGGFRERIRPSAFKAALMSSDVRSLYNHNSDMLPLGRTPKTLRLAENGVGLQMENDLPIDPKTNELTRFANDLVIAINRGDITQMSFGFIVDRDGDEWLERDGQVSRTITNIRELLDVSPVVYPAYSKTRVSVRALDKVLELRKGIDNDADRDAIIRRNQNLMLQVDSYLIG